MAEKGQVAKRLSGLRLIPPGVKEERYQRPRWLGDYRYFKTNAETLPVACLSAMQYGWSLDATIGYSSASLGKIRPNLGASSGRNLMR